MMTNRRIVLFATIAVAACLLGSAGARADVIDGNWCAADGRMLSISGPRIVTPGGTATTGDYSRHRFAYVVPASEAGAGTPILMILLNEETVRIDTGKTSEIWHRCDVTS